MKNLLGVMQGRLLPKYKGRYQAHPVGYWQDEFPIAEKLGLDCIEFILDFNDVELNPLSSKEGIKKIQDSIEKSNVKVYSICADYFMEAPLHSADEEVVKRSQEVLYQLLESSKKIGVKEIVIPCVDQSTFKTKDDQFRLKESLTPMIKIAEENELHLSLETDLDPDSFLSLIQVLDSKSVCVNYDIGNSAALGFNPMEEFQKYGKFISDIHIKDRILGGGSIELGKGNANFGLVLDCMRKTKYTGPLIMQAYRDDEGLEIFKKQLIWVKNRFCEFLEQ